MSEQPERTNFNEQIKNLLLPAVADIDNAPKGEMTLFAPSKNLRILITAAKKVNSSITTGFQHSSLELKPAVAILVSCQDMIQFNVSTSPCLSFYLHISDLTPRFIEYVKSLPNLIEPKSKSKPATKPTSDSFISNYTESHEDFERYCREVPKTKIQYKQAVAKWTTEMAEFPTLAKFTEHVVKVKEAVPPPAAPTPTATLEQYHKYLLETPASKLRKTYIKENFSNLDDSVTFLNETKDFLPKLKEYQRSLKDKK